MPRHNSARVPVRGLRYQPPPPNVDGTPLLPDDRVTFGTPSVRPRTGRVLWCEWRAEDGTWIDPRNGRDSRHGHWRALVAPDDGGPSSFVNVSSLHRERVAQ